MNYLRHDASFQLENGQTIDGLTIAYHTFGTLNADCSNVVWICHHLTANSDAALWWSGMIGENTLINPSRHFIICANILGSCYGTTGPQSIDPSTGKPWYRNFPAITIRDMVQAHILLREHLGIEKINLLVGGSMGGYQALEWAVAEPDRISNMLLLSTSAAESAWGIAIHTAQRMAIEADGTWENPVADAGKAGLKAARAMGLISYRNHGILVIKQTDPDLNKTDDFKASQYIRYQGDKLARRFNAHSYYTLTKAMDTHHLARGRQGSSGDLLRQLSPRTLVIGIHSDLLCPLSEQAYLAEHLPDAQLVVIDSAYGHDGFMVESDLISRHLQNWWNG